MKYACYVVTVPSKFEMELRSRKLLTVKSVDRPPNECLLYSKNESDLQLIFSALITPPADSFAIC